MLDTDSFGISQFIELLYEVGTIISMCQTRKPRLEEVRQLARSQQLIRGREKN